MQEAPIICQKNAESGKVALRNAVVLAYFVHRPAHEICGSVAAMLDEYLSCIPADALKWAIPNASAEQWKPVDQKTLPGIKKLLDPQGVKARELTSFRLADSAGEAPAFEFRFVGKPKSYKSPPACSLVQVVFPIETAREVLRTDPGMVRHLFVSGSPGPWTRRTRRATGVEDPEFVARIIEFAGYRHRAFDDPDPWGMLIADVTRHIARIYATESNLSQDQVIERVRTIYDAEMAEPTDTGTTSTIS